MKTNNEKRLYMLGDMLYCGSQLLRAQEVQELREMGLEIYSAAEQNKDGDINDKKGQTEQTNNDLHAHIFKKDIDNIMASNIIVANPERFAEGSICELGAVEMFNHIHQTMTDIVMNDGLSAEEKIQLINEWLHENPYKATYVYLADIRCTDLKESGFNRSFYMNQFVRGCGVAAMTGKRGIPVSQGAVEIMDWEGVKEALRIDFDLFDDLIANDIQGAYNDYDFLDDYDAEIYGGKPCDDTQVEPIEFEAIYDSEHRY